MVTHASAGSAFWLFQDPVWAGALPVLVLTTADRCRIIALPHGTRWIGEHLVLALSEKRIMDCHKKRRCFAGFKARTAVEGAFCFARKKYEGGILSAMYPVVSGTAALHVQRPSGGIVTANITSRRYKPGRASD
jgi:hypothetical protein